jgi:hypothetical protein
MTAFEVLSLGFTIGSILLGAATFILGFYLVERNRGVTSGQRKPFKYLLLSLIIPLFLVIPTSLVAVYSELSGTIISFVALCIICFFIPVFAVLAILHLTWS